VLRNKNLRFSLEADLKRFLQFSAVETKNRPTEGMIPISLRITSVSEITKTTFLYVALNSVIKK